MEIKFKPIGAIHVKGSDTEVRENGDLEGELEIYPEFAEGLDGIDEYSHLFVVVYLHQLRPDQIGPLKVKPRGAAQERIQAREVAAARRFCPGLADAAEPHRLDLGIAIQTGR